MDNYQQGTSQSYIKAMHMPAMSQPDKNLHPNQAKLKYYLHRLYQPKTKSMGMLCLIKQLSLLMLDTIQKKSKDWLHAKANDYAQALTLEFQPVENRIGCHTDLRKRRN